MIPLKVGRRFLNLDYLVMTEDPAGSTPGSAPMLVTMARGRDFVLLDEEAAVLRTCLEALVASPCRGRDAAEGDEGVIMAESQDPRTGAPLPRASRVDEQGS